jgi:hypothetical protein
LTIRQSLPIPGLNLHALGSDLKTLSFSPSFVARPIVVTAINFVPYPCLATCETFRVGAARVVTPALKGTNGFIEELLLGGRIRLCRTNRNSRSCNAKYGES